MASKSIEAEIGTSVAAGRYAIRRFLGEGARKRVYLAHDSLLDREVAIARIKTEGLDEAGRTRVRRETQAMARLGDHTNIVNIFDVIEEEDRLLLVSQFMAGGSIQELLDSAESRRLPLADVMRIGAETAAALEHAHTRGIVHRDLKPANVWLSADGVAKLGDFGLAVALDQSRLTAEGLIVGTVAYIAPEQALGKPPDERSDLYSLGAMLYEMLTGRPPFLGDDAVGVISQHLTTAPVGPSWHNPDVPPAVEALILQLLEKDPEKRPATATHVKDALAAIAAKPEELSERVVHEDINPLDRLAGGVFVGREDEMRELKGYVDDALAGRPRLLMLVGEPGIGKTRTSEEVATYARLRGAQLLIGRCYEGEGAPAYWPWIQLIRSYVTAARPESLATEMGTGAANIAQIVSEVRDRLPDLPEPPALEPEQARFRLFDSIATFLRNAAKQQPILIVIDDLHWADKPSLLLLQFLARDLQEAKVLGIGTYRDVELGRHHPLAQTLAELARENIVRRVVLRGLSEQDVRRFIELTSGISPKPDLVKAVHLETEGNPFFMTETVRLLVSEGRLRETSGSWSITIPQGVREVIGRRLNRLSEKTNEILTIAAVIGRDFGLNILEKVSDQDQGEVLEALEEAMEARLVGEEHGIGRYRFAHALVRETLYEDISTTQRIRLHRRTGEVLEAASGGDRERYLPELSHHFFEAAALGEAERAIRYSRAAAERAMRLTAYEEAAALYRRALEVYEVLESPDKSLQCELFLRLGRAQTSAGETGPARTSFAKASELAFELGDNDKVAEAAIGAGDVWVSAGWSEAGLITLLESALDFLPKEDSSHRARLLGRFGEALRFTERREEEEVLSRESVDMARRLGDMQVLAQTLFWRIIALGAPRKQELRRQATMELVSVARQINDPRSLLLGLRNLFILQMEDGNIRDARLTVGEYEVLADELKLPLFAWFIPLMKSGIAFAGGDLDKTDELLQEARRQGLEAGDPNVEPFIFPTTFLLRIRQGRIEELREYLEPGSRLKGFMWGLSSIPHLQLLTGDREGAREALEHQTNTDFAEVTEDWGQLWFLCDFATLASELGDRRAAARLYDLMLPFEHFHAVGYPGASRGPIAHVLGMVAGTLEQFESAERHFEHAVRETRRVDIKPTQPEVDYAYAQMLIARGAPGDRERAKVLTTSALDAAEQMKMTGLVQEIVSLKLSLQGQRPGDMMGSLHVVAEAVDEERPDLQTHASPDGTVTLLFSDIEGSTELNEALGDDRWFQVLRMHNDIVRKHIGANRGYEVKNNGDGFMVAFPSARSALMAAIGLQRSLEEHGRTAAVPVRVRIGIHTGETVRQADDFFGRHVNLAARVAAQASGGEILVSSLTRALVSGSGFEFDDERDVELKGFKEPQRVARLIWQDDASAPSVPDSVQVTPQV